MTTVVAPVRRPRVGTPAPSRARSAPRRTSAPTRARAAAPAASRARARAGVTVAVVVVVVLVSAVLFHVLLAQGQLQLDHLDSRIASERLEYERRLLQVSTLSSPQRIIEQAEALGLVIPDTPIYLEVPGAKVPAGRAVNPATTLGDWEDVKPHLGDAER
jgi:hypothetical protein